MVRVRALYRSCGGSRQLIGHPVAERRFDQVSRELADNRERMAKLEGALEGFLAGRRDRNAA